MDNPGGYSYIQQVVVDGGAGVSCVAVDPREELIWMGGGGGHVSSYYGAACEKYTSFQAHPQGYPVRDLCVHSEGVISLSPNALRMNVRRGPTRWVQTSEDFCDLYTMTLLGKTEHRLAVSGNQPSLLEVDINRNGQILRRVALDDTGYKILRHNPQFLCCADFAGGIDLRSKDNFQVVHHFEPSSTNMMIQDMAVLGNQLVTCGVSDHYGRQTNHMYLRVYDLRMFRPQLLQMLFPPVLLRFLESYTSRVVCVSTAGQFQVLDVGLLETASPVNSIDPGVLQFPISCFDVCPSSQGIVFGDDGGNLYLYGTGTDIHFHNFCSNTPEFADPVDTPPAMDVLDPINILSSIPMPIPAGPLLSDLPPNVTRFRYHVAQPLDPSILGSIKMVGSIGYAPNNGRLRRNECSYILNKHAVASFKQQDQSPSHESQIPLYYHKIDIKYNKLGIEDFDYNQYNNTCFAGLESSLPNCYSNDMLQVFYFLEPLRMMLTNHSCEREFCLACELAYLFHMLENAQGMPCQASNFLRAFRTIPEVSALGLLFNEDRFTGCKQLIQGWTRFMFTQLHQETADERTGVSVITQLFSIPQKILHRCWCGATRERETTTNMIHLTYTNTKEELGQNVSFADILRQSMCPSDNQINTWCDSCVRYNTTMESRRPTALPDILVINCGLDSAVAMDLWARKGSTGPLDGQSQSAVVARAGQGDNSSIQFINKKCRFGDKCNRRSCRFQHSDTPDPFAGVRGERDTGSSSPGQSWLPFKLNIAVRGDAGGVTVRETELNNADGINYELAAIVCVILHDSRENIISLINVGAGYHERHHSSGMSHWYVFNDFTVHSVKENEVGHVPINWKQPCMLYYTRKDIALKYKDLKVISPITEDIIRKDTSIGAAARLKTFTPLLDSEQFNAGDIVAMDAEFVTLNQEEAEIRSDGTRATIRPSQRSVARISCLRGQGQMEGVAFIDDYIATQEQVVDYLTQFSGIQPGDLDVTVSSKHLTTLKATYQKLRLLVDKGVIFVGHGLKNDFRVINLVVPQEQVRDTVLLFQLRNKRMLSLRFLAWHFFGETIQSETHDSIEDAKTALRLYRKFLELRQRDEINAALTELYEVGKKYSWKVPKDNGGAGGHSNAGTPAAPLD